MNDQSISKGQGSTESEEDLNSKEVSLEKVTATSYVPQPQYEKWKREADERNQSISTLIAAMVETGLNKIEIENNSPSEILDLRAELRQVRSERDDLHKKLRRKERGDSQVGLGRIKELILRNPGIDRREIINYTADNTASFVGDYLESLQISEFKKQDGQWYPPESMEDRT